MQTVRLHYERRIEKMIKKLFLLMIFVASVISGAIAVSALVEGPEERPPLSDKDDLCEKAKNQGYSNENWTQDELNYIVHFCL